MSCCFYTIIALFCFTFLVPKQHHSIGDLIFIPLIIASVAWYCGVYCFGKF